MTISTPSTTCTPALTFKAQPFAATAIALVLSTSVHADDDVIIPSTYIDTDFAVSTNMSVYQTGPLTVDGNTTLDVGLTANLSNPGNEFIGSVSGTAFDLILTDKNSLQLGDLYVYGDAELTAGGNITQLGTITADTLHIDSAGNVTLTAAGNAVSRLGTVNVDGDFSLTNGTALTVAGPITASTVTFGGTSTVTLVDGMHIIAAQVTRNDGILLVNGTIDGAVDIEGDATLAGAGVVGDTQIRSGGTLAAGNSIGTLTVDGNLTFDTGSRLVVEVNPAGTDADLVDVTGDITIDGGTVAHIGNDGTYALNSTYTILRAGGTLSGAFASSSSEYAFLTPDLGYDYAEGTVTLSLTRNNIEFVSAAETPNQAATATAINSIGIAAGNDIYEAVALLPDDDDVVRVAFDALSGAANASALSALLTDSHLVQNAMIHRLLGRQDAAPPEVTPVLSYASAAAYAFPSLESAANDTSFWAEGFGSWGMLEGDGNAATLERATGGLLIGAETNNGPWRVGALFGYGRSSYEISDSSSAVNTRNYLAGVYGGGGFGDFAVRGGLAYALNDVTAERTVALPGITEELSASYLAGTVQAFGEIAYGLEVGAARFEPFANLAYASTGHDGYAEQGGASALIVDAARHGVTFATLGGRIEHTTLLGEAEATLTGSLAWRHAFGELAPTVAQAFSAGDSFTIAGTPIDRDSALVGLGLGIALAHNTTLDLSYSGEVSANTAQHSLGATLAVAF